MNIKKLVTTLALSTTTLVAQSEVFTVESVGIDSEESLVFAVFDKASEESPCTANKKEFKWSLNDGTAYAIYSLALHAHRNNIQLDVGTSTRCIDSQPTSNWIKLKH